MTSPGPDGATIRDLLTELAMGLVGLRLYGAEHPRAEEAVRRAASTLEGMLGVTSSGTVTLLELEGELVVEGQPAGHLGAQAASVARAMRRAGVERITLARGLDTGELAGLLAFLAKPGGDPPRFAHAVLGRVELAGGEAGGGEDAPGGRPAVVLRDRVVVTGEVLQAVAAGSGDGVVLGEDLVDELDRRAGETHPLELLAPLEDAPDWPAVHSHNVAALAIGAAHLLGLERDERLDLGLAALLHDVGRVPFEAQWIEDLEREGEPLEGDPGHPLRGLGTVLKLENLPPLVPLVVLDHHVEPSGPQRSPHPAARLVGALESFDILHTVRGPAGRITREGVRAWCQEAAGTRMDPFLARLLILLQETAPTA